MEKCPFNVGDTVRFVPSNHSKGWSPHRNDAGLIDNQKYKVLRIVEDKYLFVSPKQTNGWHWKDFKLIAKEVRAL